MGLRVRVEGLGGRVESSGLRIGVEGACPRGEAGPRPVEGTGVRV